MVITPMGSTMSQLNRQVKYKKRLSNRGGFKSFSGGVKSEPMGLSRALATSGFLILAALSSYTAILYMLPFVSPKQILGISQQNYAASSLDGSRMSWLKNTFLKPFELRRTFLGTTQGIRAHYVIPEGMLVDLKIEHCMRAVIVEAYSCKVVGTSTAEIAEGMGSRRFKFSEVGFYQFKDQLRYKSTGKVVPKTDQSGYRIIWARD